MGDPHPATPEARPLAESFGNSTVLLTGATGFLGKVVLATILDRFSEVGRVDALIRPGREGTGVQGRFEDEILDSPVLEPVRRARAEGYEAFCREKVRPIAADLSAPLLGLDSDEFDRLASEADLVLHCAGLVDFTPPLDLAVAVNMDGTAGILELCRRGGARLVHVSTTFVSGSRRGVIPERAVPGEAPEGRDFGGESEREACRALVARVEATWSRNGRTRRPVSSHPRAKRELREIAQERAEEWGFPNAYTYSKAVAEQLILEAEDVDAVIARPSVLESAMSFPEPGWMQGINTSAPLVYLAAEGQRFWPTREGHVLDVLPVDMAAQALVAIGGRHLEGEADGVYHLASGDVNPFRTARLIELTGLHFRTRSRHDTLLRRLRRRLFETLPVSRDFYEKASTPLWKRAAGKARDVLQSIPSLGGRASGLDEARRRLVDKLGKTRRGLKRLSGLIEQYLPFLAGPMRTYSTARTRELLDDLRPADREAIVYRPGAIDWRDYWMNVHLPGLERYAFPEMRRKASRSRNRETSVPREVETLPGLLEAVAARQGRVKGFGILDPDGGERTHRYRDALRRATAGARRLREAGVGPGDRVVVWGENRPEWVFAYLAILGAGGTAVPLDAGLSIRDAGPLVEASGARRVVVTAARREVLAEAGSGETFRGAPVLTAGELCRPDDGPERFPHGERSGDAIASLIYTSGTTGAPKGVLLSHRAFLAQARSLERLFPLDSSDRILSVLPLHHAFEFTCGFVLPLSLGIPIRYLWETSPEAVREGLGRVRPTAMLGVPALFEAFHRRIQRKVQEKGQAAEKAFELLRSFHRSVRERTGQNLGRNLFPDIHEAFGGSIRFLVSGGAALSPEVHEAFWSYGLDVAEGYGLTEAGPVIACHVPGEVRPGADGGIGTVGRPIPDVEVRIADPGDDGVGEICARGPSIMEGYDGDPETTAEAIDDEGWLHTGDLGCLDESGRLEIAGRSKEVIVDAAGNTVYPDEVEELYGDVAEVAEIGVARVRSASGKEVVGALVVPRVDSEACRRRIRERFDELEVSLPFPKRIKVLRFTDRPLPRTATRKVKRDRVSAILDRMGQEEAEEASRGETTDGAALEPAVRRTIATIAGVEPDSIHEGSRLQEDLGLDSMAVVELVSALAETTGRDGPDSMEGISTVADLLSAFDGKAPETGPSAGSRESDPDPTSRVIRSIDRTEEEPEAIDLPRPVRRAGKAVLTALQLGTYELAFDVKVLGRAHIPHHTNCVVVANHTSHLDVGLCKVALGDYGRTLHSVAAKDYFFSSTARRTYFENFTRVLPFDRREGMRGSLDRAVSELRQGKTVLFFPEGTRSVTGEMQPFKAGLGYLARNAGVGILPIHLTGPHEALPKGSSVPTSRELEARIGPFLSPAELEEETEGLDSSEAYRAIADRAHDAVASLGRDRAWPRTDAPVETAGDEPVPVPAPGGPLAELDELMEALPGRFRPGTVDRPTTYYVKVGDGERRWTIRVDSRRAEVREGRPAGRADCVLTAEPPVVKRLLSEGRTPTWTEIASGSFRTDDPTALQTLGQAFGLTTAGEGRGARPRKR